MLTEDELAYFKNELEEMKKQIESNLDSTSFEMNSLRDNEPKDEGDHATMQRRQTIGNSILLKQSEKLEAIERSLKRIENDTYGICEACEEEINIERLKVKVFADYCISCREAIEKENS
ncbi:MAG: C4-type zinc finger protein, DksA/TraR family [uncultured Sulfurovum sp.]|uniref:C4-type zinc finger protein, DksA/TraR family n=1 Tax=uncultured Sulfurovum sp. TaxID=269237 RepID=A0A6S6SBC4_9BACT|nr:MAG: C4-type zinc finger protein, DksA/TraR family [uncultured Sulfurovum sp.]